MLPTDSSNEALKRIVTNYCALYVAHSIKQVTLQEFIEQNNFVRAMLYRYIARYGKPVQANVAHAVNEYRLSDYTTANQRQRYWFEKDGKAAIKKELEKRINDLTKKLLPHRHSMPK